MIDFQSPEFAARFEANFTPEPNSGCWLWTGSMSNSYGTLSFKGKALRAHRVSYMMSKGVIGPGQVLMHSCDNKACVNPDHLTAGSVGDNVRDYHRKLRVGDAAYLKRAGTAPLSSGPLRVLSDAYVLAIRASTASNRDIAKFVGVNHTVIGLIKRGLAYAVTAPGALPCAELTQQLRNLPSMRSPPRGWDSPQRVQAREMRGAGASFTEIARTLGVGRGRAFELARHPSGPLDICH